MKTAQEKHDLVQQSLPFTPTFGDIEINGVSVVTATFDGKLWLWLGDIYKVMSYSKTVSIRDIYATCRANQIEIGPHVTRFMKPTKRWFIDLTGMWMLCGILQPHRTTAIRGWLEVNAEAEKPAGSLVNRINTKVFTVNIGEHQALVAFAKNRIWLSSPSIRRCFEYKNRSCLFGYRGVIVNSGLDLKQCQLYIRNNNNALVLFMDSHAVKVLSERTRRGQSIVAWLAELENWSEGVEALIRKVGGTDVHDAIEVVKPDAAPSLPGVQPQSPADPVTKATAPAPVDQAAVTPTVPAKDVLRAVLTPPAQASQPKPDAKTEHQRDYCKKLCSVVARYLTAAELPVLVQTLETFKSNVLQKRYSPGLNDAAYDLYANFHLRGQAAQVAKEPS